VQGSPEAVRSLKNQRISFQIWPAHGESHYSGAAGAVNLGHIVWEFGHGNRWMRSGAGDTFMYYPTDHLPKVPYDAE
jgi:hypothetical protein